MPRSTLPITLLSLLCAAAIAAYGLLSPIDNWDLIGYVASALSNTGLTGQALHDATYASLQAALPPERFDMLTSNGPYARGVYSDPEALEQQLPFYRIRVLYILILQAIAALTQSLAQATYVLSAVAAAILTVLTGALLKSRAQTLPIYLTGPVFITILYLCAIPQLARLSTPDALFSVGAITALALFHRARTASLLIVAVLPLIRTDAILLAALLLMLLLVERARDPRHYAALAASAALYFWINSAYDAYGHLTLFNFTLIPGQRTPYPADLIPVTDLGAYIQVYLESATAMLTRWVPWILLAGGLAVAAERRRTGHIASEGYVTLVAIAYVVLHFAAFPLGEARHYSFALLFCCIQATHVLALSTRKTSV